MRMDVLEVNRNQFRMKTIKYENNTKSRSLNQGVDFID